MTRPPDPTPPTRPVTERLRDAAASLRDRWMARPPERAISPREVRVTRAVALALSLAAIVVVGAFADGPAALAVRGLPGALVRAFAAVTDFGTSGWMFAVCLALWLWAAGTGRALLADRAAFAVAALAASGIAAQVVKHLAGRARPSLMDLVGPFHFDAFSIKASLASFPSGHAASIVTAGFALWAFAPRWRAPVVAFGAIVCLSRLVVRAHYVSDVLGGMLLGWLVTWAMARLFAGHAIAFRWGRSSAVPIAAPAP